MNDAAYRDVHYSAADGLRLHARIYGEAEGGLPVVCLPGLTRNARDFHELALFLSRDAKTGRKVVSFDYRGRGGSDYDRDWRNYDVRIEAADIVAGLDALGIAEAAFIGTSRGGLIIFALAVLRPAALKAVVLNDIGPVIEGAGLAHIQTYLKRAPKPKTFAEAVQIQRSANGDAFSALSDADWERMTHAIYRDEDGRPVADFDPAIARATASVDFSKPLPVLWPQFMGLAGMPVLAIRGANSRLLSAETFSAMAQKHPDLQPIIVEGQGHAPLLETGDLPRRIADFIDKAEARARR